MKPPILASVIVPTCDRPQALRQCLDALIPQIRNSGADVELIICDDSRNVDTARMVRTDFPTASLLAGPRRGPAANRNLGAERAGGKWLIFFDDDVVPNKACLSVYLSSIYNAGSDTVFEGSTVTDVDFNPAEFEAPINLKGGALRSCNFAISREFFGKMQGFRECFTHWMEDVDLHRRLKILTAPIAFLPNACVYHPPRRIPSIFARAQRWRARAFFERLWGKTPWSLSVWLPCHVWRFRVSPIRLTPADTRRFVHGTVEAILVAVQLPFWLIGDTKQISAVLAPQRRNEFSKTMEKC